MSADLDAPGWAGLLDLVGDGEGGDIVGMYDGGKGFRSHVVMARHGFGQREYRYFAYPLPDLVQDLRTALCPRLVPIANAWHERMGNKVRFPANHAEFLDRCHDAGQVRPTPLLLQYGPGDYNCLHQDVYGDGEHVFPMQVATLLSQPGDDFQGGEFVMTEQRPRMQTRVAIVPLNRGDAVLFSHLVAAPACQPHPRRPSGRTPRSAPPRPSCWRVRVRHIDRSYPRRGCGRYCCTAASGPTPTTHEKTTVGASSCGGSFRNPGGPPGTSDSGSGEEDETQSPYVRRGDAVRGLGTEQICRGPRRRQAGQGGCRAHTGCRGADSPQLSAEQFT